MTGGTFAKQIALVTGASSGIGQATVIALQKAGYIVYAGVRKIDEFKSFKDSAVRTVVLDVTDDALMKDAVNQIQSEARMINVLVNCAGYGSYGAFEDIPMSEAKRQFEVNLFGLARLSQLVIPKMRESRSGTIINISSIGGRIGDTFGTWYHATKYAVEGLSESLSLELAPFNIKVVVVEPGIIKTAWTGVALENLFKASGNGVYAKAAIKKAEHLKSLGEQWFASSPCVVANGIVKILKKRHPKFRYPIGGGAEIVMFLRKILPDRFFNYIMSRYIG